MCVIMCDKKWLENDAMCVISFPIFNWMRSFVFFRKVDFLNVNFLKVNFLKVNFLKVDFQKVNFLNVDLRLRMLT
jgi:uncharacterized protein YjbI with pentapeptide repeats